MPVRPLVSCFAALCMLFLSHAASGAQLYKWVDERGVTNYSDQPPASAVKQETVVLNRVSVYTPDPLLVRAVEAERARAIEDLSTGRRSRELQADWLARQYFAAIQAQPVDPCAGDAGCGGYMPFAYAPASGHFPKGRGPRILPQIDLVPGTTAGNVTAGTGYIPGYSSAAPPASAPALRGFDGGRGSGKRHGAGGPGRTR